MITICYQKCSLSRFHFKSTDEGYPWHSFKHVNTVILESFVMIKKSIVMQKKGNLHVYHVVFVFLEPLTELRILCLLDTRFPFSINDATVFMMTPARAKHP